MQGARQLLISCYNCTNLEDHAKLLSTMVRAAAAVGCEIREQVSHQFTPHGITAVLVLAESHFIVSTYPEFNYVFVDIFLCNSTMDPYTIWNELKLFLKCETQVINELIHHIGCDDDAI